VKAMQSGHEEIEKKEHFFSRLQMSVMIHPGKKAMLEFGGPFKILDYQKSESK
jgi:hypothetical protein